MPRCTALGLGQHFVCTCNHQIQWVLYVPQWEDQKMMVWVCLGLFFNQTEKDTVPLKNPAQ